MGETKQKTRDNYNKAGINQEEAVVKEEVDGGKS